MKKYFGKWFYSVKKPLFKFAAKVCLLLNNAQFAFPLSTLIIHKPRQSLKKYFWFPWLMTLTVNEKLHQAPRIAENLVVYFNSLILLLFLFFFYC